MTKQLDEVNANMVVLQDAVAKEMQQLAAALDLAKNADAPEKIQAVADKLRGLADTLASDDEPAPAPTPVP